MTLSYELVSHASTFITQAEDCVFLAFRVLSAKDYPSALMIKTENSPLVRESHPCKRSAAWMICISIKELQFPPVPICLLNLCTPKRKVYLEFYNVLWVYTILWLTLLCIAKLLKIGPYCIMLSCIWKSFVGIKSAMGAFSPQMPNHLNQSCFLQQIKSSGLHNTTLPKQSFTCYCMSYHSFLLAFLKSSFPASLSSCILLLSSDTSTAVLISLRILTLIVFSCFFIYFHGWLVRMCWTTGKLRLLAVEDWEIPKTSKAAIGELYIFDLLYILIIINPKFSLNSVTTCLSRITEDQISNPYSSAWIA